MNDIIITGPEDRPLKAAGLTRINRSNDLQAGTYWRAKNDVPELTKPITRKRGIYLPEDHPDYIHKANRWDSSENQIGYEEYEVEVPVRQAIPMGRMHLVKNLKLVDDEIHAVVLQGHPNEKKGQEYTYLVDEFLHYFELIDDKEAQQIRQDEISRLQQEITDLQKAMIAGPPDEAPVAFLGEQRKLPSQPDIGTMVANIQHIQHLSQGAERALAVAQKQTEWISQHTKAIGQKTEQLVPFYQEKAAAALASTNEVMLYAKNLKKGVETLGLYTGQGVDVRRVAEGQSADPTEKLVIYREMLFMDEEYLINLDQNPESCGADHEDFDDFVAEISKNEKLRDRIFPYPRMVVLMRYRRTDKVYFKGNSREAALLNDFYNEPNRAQFLLVRDGENYWQIWSELTTQKIRSLYPTKGMGDEPFKGVDGKDIGLKDLDFAEAKSSFDDLNRVYKNLLILMWGLNDRENVFGPFYNPEDYTSLGFTDELFQQKYFTFWDPYAGGNIGTGRPRFEKWVRKMNSWLRSGSRVVIMKSVLRYNPAIGRLNTMAQHQPSALKELGNEALEYIVRKTAKGHVVPVKAGRTIYPKNHWEKPYEFSQEYDVPLNEDKDFGRYDSLEWLCLDMIEASDIDHYLESRYDRPFYMNYYPLMLKVRDQLKMDEKLLNPIIAKLEEAYRQAPVPLPDDMNSRDLAKHAVRLWRTSHRGEMPPGVDEKGHDKAYKTMLASMWTLAGNDHPVEAAERLCANEKRIPLRLVLTGKDKFAVYTTSIGDEIENRLFDHVWVTRLSCDRKNGELKVRSKKVMPLPKEVADEEVLKEWEEAVKWLDHGQLYEINNQNSGYNDEKVEEYTYHNIRKSFDILKESSLEIFYKKPENLEALLIEMNKFRSSKTRNQVKNLITMIPFGIIAKHTQKSEAVPGFVGRYKEYIVESGYRVTFLKDNSYAVLYRLCETEEERKLVIDYYVKLYNSKEYQKNNLLEMAAKRPRIVNARLPESHKIIKGFYQLEGYFYDTHSLSSNWYNDIQKILKSDYRTKDQKIETKDIWKHIPDHIPYQLNAMCEKYGWEPIIGKSE